MSFKYRKNIKINPAYGRHWLSRLMRIETPIPFFLFTINIFCRWSAVEVLLKCCLIAIEVPLKCRWSANGQQPTATARDLLLLTPPIIHSRLVQNYTFKQSWFWRFFHSVSLSNLLPHCIFYVGNSLPYKRAHLVKTSNLAFWPLVQLVKKLNQNVNSKHPI